MTTPLLTLPDPEVAIKSSHDPLDFAKTIKMNDTDIRSNAHKKILNHHHKNNNTLIIDELGLHHGNCRADIAVINGNLHGFEIKSDKDTLSRLNTQVGIYDSIFDYSIILAGEKHYPKLIHYLPDHWGIVLCVKGNRGGINFHSERKPKINTGSDPYSIAQLLWRDEAIEILKGQGVSNKEVNRPRAELYTMLSSRLTKTDLKRLVRDYLRKRTAWRCHKSPFQYDDSSRQSAR